MQQAGVLSEGGEGGGGSRAIFLAIFEVRTLPSPLNRWQNGRMGMDSDYSTVLYYNEVPYVEADTY